MKKYFLAAAFLCILALPGFTGHHDVGELSEDPEATEEHSQEEPSRPANEFEGRTALLFDFGIVDPLVEVKGVFEGTAFAFQYRSLTLGSYFRVLKNLKLGAFYRLQAGVRHDADLIDTGSGLAWDDTRQRYEHLLLFDATPRFQLAFLPGKSWILNLKNRYIFNTYNNQHALLVRPGITYVLMPNRQPLFNFSFQYGLYIPLNFGNTFIYEHTPYIDILFHLQRAVKLELKLAYRTVLWDFEHDPDPVRSSTFGIGLGVLITP